MFPQSRLSVELFSTLVACHCVLSVVVKHVRFKLRVLNEFFAANFAFVISPACVRPDVSVERFLGCKLVATLWTCVWTFAGMNASKNQKVIGIFQEISQKNSPVLRQSSGRRKTFAAIFPVAQIRLFPRVCTDVNVEQRRSVETFLAIRTLEVSAS